MFPDEMPLSGVCFGAADAIETFGHAKHALVIGRGGRSSGEDGSDGSVCLRGAINFVANDDSWTFTSATAQIEAQMKRMRRFRAMMINDHGEFDPVRWNNLPERTADEVIAVLLEVGAELALKGL